MSVAVASERQKSFLAKSFWLMVHQKAIWQSIGTVGYYPMDSISLHLS